MSGQRKRIRAGIKRMLVAVTDDDRFMKASKQLFSGDQRSGVGSKKGKKTPEDVWAAIRAETVASC